MIQFTYYSTSPFLLLREDQLKNLPLPPLGGPAGQPSKAERAVLGFDLGRGIECGNARVAATSQWQSDSRSGLSSLAGKL